MAFISMIFAFIFMILMALSFVALIVGIVLLVKWRIKVKNKKNVSKTHKVFAVICSVYALLFYVLPLIGSVVLLIISNIKTKNELEQFERIVEIESINDYVDGFVVDGVSYIRSDYPQYINNDIAQQFCAFVYPNGHFDECIIMQTDAGYDVLYVKNHRNNIYVREDQYDDICVFYTEETTYKARVLIFDNGDDELGDPIDYQIENFDYEEAKILRDYYSAYEFRDFECNPSEIEYSVVLDVYSQDGLCRYDDGTISLYIVDGNIVWPHGLCVGQYLRGHVITEEDVGYDYLSSIVNQQSVIQLINN